MAQSHQHFFHFLPVLRIIIATSLLLTQEIILLSRVTQTGTRANQVLPSATHSANTSHEHAWDLNLVLLFISRLRWGWEVWLKTLLGALASSLLFVVGHLHIALLGNPLLLSLLLLHLPVLDILLYSRFQLRLLLSHCERWRSQSWVTTCHWHLLWLKG